MTEVQRQRRERSGTAAAWSFANPILMQGEFGYDTTSGMMKIGDGFTAWNSLPYASFKASAQVGLSFAASTVGVIGTFTAPARVQVAITVASGTVNSAVVQIETVSDSVPRGIFRYSPGVAWRWLTLANYGLSCRARLLSISGGGTINVSV